MSKSKKKLEAEPTLDCSALKNFSAPLLHKVATKIVVDDPKFIPKYQTEGSACVDLIANISNTITLPSRNTAIIDCGFSMELTPGYKALIVPRSGFASRGLIVANSPGQIDSDYRGRVKVIVLNASREIITINPEERFAQMYIEPVYAFEWVLTNQLSSTDRGTGGFGSTGVR